MKRITFPIIVLSFILSAQAQAACTWREQTIISNGPEIGGSQIIGGCYSDESRATGSQTCEGSRPSSSYICCCGNEITNTAPSQASEAKFTVPELQVAIPGLDQFTEPTDCDTDSSGNKINCKFSWIAQYMAAWYKYGFNIVGILAVIILMVGGVIWLTSAGDAGRVGQAKKMIAGAIAGILVLFSSFLILGTINPSLVNFMPLGIDMVSSKAKKEAVAISKNGSLAEQYKQMPCPTLDELSKGVEFFATGYYKPKWENSDSFFCEIAMNCSCPNGQDTSKTCKMYESTFPNYHPCIYFDESTPYCNTPALTEGDIAADLNCFQRGDKICVGGTTTYTIKDTGGAIKGRRIDIWSGDDITTAYGHTGKVTVTGGPCK